MTEFQHSTAGPGGWLGVVPPYLDLTPLLSSERAEGGFLPGSDGSSSTLRATGWRTKHYPEASEATIIYYSGRMGSQFEMVTDRHTGERLRAYQLAEMEAQEQAHFDGMRAARWDGEYDPRTVELLAERAYWRMRGYVVPPLPESAVVQLRGEQCARCMGRVSVAFRELDEGRRARTEREHARRAASKVRRFCKAWRIDHLWTLTYRGEGERDYKQLRHDVDAFFKRFKVLVGHIPLVMVREPHPGGHGWHCHFGVPGWVSIKAIRACWPHGSVNVQGRRQGASPRKVAGYIAKYVSKGFDPAHCEASGVADRLPGEHRYWINQGFALTPVVYMHERKGHAIGDLVERAGWPVYLWESASVADWHGPPCLWLDLPGVGLDDPPPKRR